MITFFEKLKINLKGDLSDKIGNCSKKKFLWYKTAAHAHYRFLPGISPNLSAVENDKKAQKWVYLI